MTALSNFPVLRNKHGDGQSDLKPHDGGGKHSEFWNFVKGGETRDPSKNEIFCAAVEVRGKKDHRNTTALER